MHKIRNHWEQVYKKNNHKGLSWYQKTLKKSLLYIDQYVQDKEL